MYAGEIGVYTWRSLWQGPIDGKEGTGNFPHRSRDQRERDQRALAKAEEAASHLAAIVDSSMDAIISKQLDGTITSWNKSAERLLGYTAEEAIGKSTTMLIPPDRIQEEYEILARLSRGERIKHFDTVRLRKDGTLIDLSLTVSPVRASPVARSSWNESASTSLP